MLATVPRMVFMSELSTEAMASEATTKRSFSVTDRGRAGGVGVPEMDEACGAVALMAEGVEVECCADREVNVDPRARRAIRGDGASRV
eukprot:4368204-Pleurochrysis_carterae.AAC.1